MLDAECNIILTLLRTKHTSMQFERNNGLEIYLRHAASSIRLAHRYQDNNTKLRLVLELSCHQTESESSFML
jgi:hypothetical protein